MIDDLEAKNIALRGNIEGLRDHLLFFSSSEKERIRSLRAENRALRGMKRRLKSALFSIVPPKVVATREYFG